MKPAICLAVACITVAAASSACRQPLAEFTTRAAAMAVVTVAATDSCAGAGARTNATAVRRVSAVAVWVDGRYDHDLLLFPGSGRDRYGRRFWSHYGRDSLTINRNGWVRTAIALGPDPGSSVVEMGWACLRAPDDMAAGSCVIEATRAFALGSGWVQGPNLTGAAVLDLRVGQEAPLRIRSPK